MQRRGERRELTTTGRPQKKKAITIIGVVILVAYLMGIMAGGSYWLIKQLILANQPALFLGMLMLTIAFLTIFQTIFSSINIFYFSKDITYILPLPIKPIETLMAKFNALIIGEYVMELVIVMAPIVVYGILTSAGIMFYIYALLILLIFPILPAIISCLLVMIIMTFSSLTKYKDRFQLVTGLIAISFAIGLQFVINKNRNYF